MMSRHCSGLPEPMNRIEEPLIMSWDSSPANRNGQPFKTATISTYFTASNIQAYHHHPHPPIIYPRPSPWYSCHTVDLSYPNQHQPPKHLTYPDVISIMPAPSPLPHPPQQPHPAASPITLIHNSHSPTQHPAPSPDTFTHPHLWSGTGCVSGSQMGSVPADISSPICQQGSGRSTGSYKQRIHWWRTSRIFHKRTKLAIMPLLPFLYFDKFLVFLFIFNIQCSQIFN